MLYLNNPLLTSAKIIDYFAENVATPTQAAHVAGRPSPLSQLKSKLKAIFFTDLPKQAADADVLRALSEDSRFRSNYPQLKQVLGEIFALSDTDDAAAALLRLRSLTAVDWSVNGAAAQFGLLNKKYGYFADLSEESLHDLQALFIDLAVACRTMIVLFEKNNMPGDTMAYDYAYKLMALFVDPNHMPAKPFDVIAKETFKLVTSGSESEKEHPFYDMLLGKLRLPKANVISDIEGWRAFIKKEHVRSFPFLAIAAKIEEKIAKQANPDDPRRAPCDLREANTIAALCRYSRGDEDFAFAEICHRYEVDDCRFELCLEYIDTVWPKKSHDTIPDLIIQGSAASAGLYWVKVPVTDKRILIMGDITDCCQSIGGGADACVKDAATLNDNGVYVMLKQRKKEGNPALVVDGEINDKDFKIVCQSYIWRSQTNNICLDSVECLKGEVAWPVVQSMLSDFATKLLQANPDIRYVTLGTGGKAPRDFFANAVLHEKMRQGQQYPDSVTQYCIAKTTHTAFSPQQLEFLDTLLAAYPDRFRQKIDYFLPYVTEPQNFLEQLDNLLRRVPNFARSFDAEKMYAAVARSGCFSIEECALANESETSLANSSLNTNLTAELQEKIGEDESADELSEGGCI